MRKNYSYETLWLAKYQSVAKKMQFTDSVSVSFEIKRFLNNSPLSFLCDDGVSDALTSKCFLYERHLRLKNVAVDGEISNVLGEDIIAERKLVLNKLV